MDKSQAQKVIKNTLQSSFDRGKFLYFIKNLLNKFNESKALPKISGAYIKRSFQNYINSYERLGTYTDPESKKIDILIVYLKKEQSLERARTAQRNFIARYLIDRGEKDAALVAFVSPNSDDWRFSFVKMEYKFVKTPKGNVKAKEEFTPARRYSFIVGKNENSHTAQRQLVDILIDDKHNPTLECLEKAFSIEKVTKEFFEKYRELFLILQEELDKIVSKDIKIRDDFAENGVETADFAKKLLGQIVFLYFLQKKGWFGVERDEAWGTGPKNFLRRLHSKELAGYKNFFNDILEPLFYEALAIERPKDFYSRFSCKIPFLNGGLFDPINNYNWVHTDILLPDSLFSNDIKTKEGDTGTGILDVFDRYNFTVKEDEPLEKEVAIDPEMLGKVFENLLEVKDRKSKGTYYTPREIVHYMCQESLLNYLATELKGKVKKEEIELFIRKGEELVEKEIIALEKEKQIKNGTLKSSIYKSELPHSIKEHAREIDDKLKDIRVCDPAIGSGAFPVGMMSEIVRARKTLTTYLNDEKERTPYNFKRHAIHNCLYGVDIDPGAVEIAKLRLWLSLIVDEEDIRHIKPLPNLDYKIMQGNSLLEEYEGIKLIDEHFFEKEEEAENFIKKKIGSLQQEYFQLHSKGKLTPEIKKQIKNEIKNLTKKMGAPAETNENPGLFDLVCEAKKKAEELNKLHEEFFYVTSKRKKDELKAKIDSLEWELIEATLKESGKEDKLEELSRFKRTNTKPFFLWKLHFAEVFQEKGGFDVMVANPPYVRQEKIKAIKPFLAKEFKGFYCGTADIYTYFYKRGLDLLRDHGYLCFIAPNKFMRAAYGKNTRNLLTSQATPLTIIDFCDLPIFDATTYPAILLLEKRKPKDEEKSFVATFTDIEQIAHIESTLATIGFNIPITALNNDIWNLEPPEVLALMDKLRAKGTPLKEYVNGHFYRGVLTGFNDAFVIDATTRNKLIAEDPASAEIIKPWLRGKDVKKWKVAWNRLYVIFTRRGININQYPVIKRYLEQFRADLEPKKSSKQKQGRKPGPYKWYEIQDNIAYYASFEQPKIVYPNITKTNVFAFDSTGIFTNQKCFIIPVNDLYLLAILNSKLTTRWFLSTLPRLRGGFFEPSSVFMGQFPVIPATDTQKAPIVELVQKIQTDPDGQNVLKLEAEINKQVYALYGLTDDEVVIVEGTGVIKPEPYAKTLQSTETQ